jgi:hypothetical protein
MNEEKQIRHAEQARQILENPRWVEAWDAYRSHLLHTIEQADAEDVEAVLLAKRMLSVAVHVRRHFERLIEDGKISAETVRAEQERKKWWTNRG